MIKTALIITLSASLASAWFVPTFSWGGDNDDFTNVDKNFVRDNNRSVVINEKTSKMYYDGPSSNNMHFFAAWDYCQKMDFAGYSDWRVISKNEARDLLENSRRTITVKHAFKNVQEAIYWTSTEDNFEQAWYIDFDLGRYSTKKQTYKYKAICVRDMK
ncbi:DUF1566 domain-containing protein [Sulfurimonas aquatica]|uniref:DUF1566 domain-containing protein n=1 Tax=Sulfurimonas aquatica TaxID=2672570 RepID=A0A975B0M2_9BACT|nr:DUF1566 domain-containing protein [Sulfurimonas aquatica]QSZ42047.1 DUF1566 domain-containing protein [Sulfurimonas aquatica]